MSVHGPSAAGFRPIVPPSAAPARAAAPAAPESEPAPAGSTLWDLLTDDERDFFSQRASLGALTYGPARGAAASSQAPGAPLGGRIDVKG